MIEGINVGTDDGFAVALVADGDFDGASVSTTTESIVGDKVVDGVGVVVGLPIGTRLVSGGENL